MLSILVVILSYKKINEILRAVRNLSCSGDSHDLHLKFVIVDNSEEKKLISRDTEFDTCLSDSVFLISGNNMGFSRSVNDAVEYAKDNGIDFDYIFLLNDDAYGSRHDLYKLVEVLEKHRTFGIAGPTILYSDKKRIWSSGGYFSYLTSSVRIPLKKRTVDSLLISDELCYHVVDFVSGCAMLIKRDVWETVGPLDEEIFFYEEDLEYCMRAQRSGYKVIYVVDSFFIHDISNEADRLTEFVLAKRAESFLRSRKKFLSKEWYFYSVFVLFFVHTPYKFYQILRYAKGSFTDRIHLIKSWFSGIARGLNVKWWV